jgi:phospholipid/cholesterol/gamma-HCH transport system ATP-binding protein
MGVTAEAHVEPAIELVDVVKRFDRERVLSGLNLTVPQGSITVLLGPSGAGKTVIIKHILGLLDPTSGVVKVNGQDLGKISEPEMYEIRRGMAVVLQGTLPFSCGLFYSLNVYDNVAFALQERTKWTDERIHRSTMAHLAMVGLASRADAMPNELSAGMTKRTALARALALDADIVIIDDFDSGLDRVRMTLLCEIIRDVQAEGEATFLVSTHDMDAARELADYVAVIHEGHLVAQGEADTVFASDQPLVRQLVTGDTSGPVRLDS